MKIPAFTILPLLLPVVLNSLNVRASDYFDDKYVALKSTRSDFAASADVQSRETGLYLAFWNRKKEEAPGLKYRFGGVASESAKGAKFSILIYEKEKSHWYSFAEMTGVRVVFSDQAGENIFVSSSVELNLKFPLSVEFNLE